MKKVLLSLAFIFCLPFLAQSATVYNQFSPGGALSGTWNSQNISCNTAYSATVLTLGSPCTIATPESVSDTVPLVATTGNSVNDALDFVSGVSGNTQTGTHQCAAGHTPGKYYTNEFFMIDGELGYCSGVANTAFEFTTFDGTIDAAIIMALFQDSGDGVVFGTTTNGSTTCSTGSLIGVPLKTAVTGPCSFIMASNSEPGVNAYPLVLTTGNGLVGFKFSDNDAFATVGFTTPVKWFHTTSTGTSQATVTLGDTNASSVTNIVGGSAANTQANGTPILSGFTATTGSIGGSLLAAGACSSGTVAVTNSTTAMSVSATPVTYPGDGNYWLGYVSSAGTVTVKICAAVAGTPGASTYNVRVIK